LEQQKQAVQEMIEDCSAAKKVERLESVLEHMDESAAFPIQRKMYADMLDEAEAAAAPTSTAPAPTPMATFDFVHKLSPATLTAIESSLLPASELVKQDTSAESAVDGTSSPQVWLQLFPPQVVGHVHQLDEYPPLPESESDDDDDDVNDTDRGVDQATPTPKNGFAPFPTQSNDRGSEETPPRPGPLARSPPRVRRVVRSGAARSLLTSPISDSSN
jgi:hypothetical protein